MTASQQETPVAATEERIGKYRVHPVAAMFPMLEGDEYENLRSSIKSYGQQKTILVQGDLLIDGRNRMKVCLDLGIEPRVSEYHDKLDPADHIRIANIDRRHLTEDMRSAICAKIHRWQIAQSNAVKQAAQGHHGSEGGRGRKKTLTTDSSTGFEEPKTRARDARSTVGQIAALAKVSHHKAAQADAVAKATPELLDQVATGAVKLKDAHAQVRATKGAKSPHPNPEQDYLVAKERGMEKLRDALQTLNKIYKAYPAKKADLKAEIDRMVERCSPVRR
jgi:hypothetical protein